MVTEVYGNFTDIGVFVEILMTRIRIRLQELFTLEDNNNGTRGHSLKLAKLRCSHDCWKHFLTGLSTGGMGCTSKRLGPVALMFLKIV